MPGVATGKTGTPPNGCRFAVDSCWLKFGLCGLKPEDIEFTPGGRLIGACVFLKSRLDGSCLLIVPPATFPSRFSIVFFASVRGDIKDMPPKPLPIPPPVVPAGLLLEPPTPRAAEANDEAADGARLRAALNILPVRSYPNKTDGIRCYLIHSFIIIGIG